MQYLINTSTHPFRNMAFDQVVLERLCPQEPVFYLWRNAPAVIIGLNQDAYGEVNLPFLQERGIALVRRVTGGGAVYHDLQNLNYSFVGPIKMMEHALEWMPKSLKELGLEVERSGRNDLLIDGRKCSGYAKRLSGRQVMMHGTLMWDVDIDTLTEALKTPTSKLQAAGVASVRSRVANLKDFLPQLKTIEAFQEALQAILAGNDSEMTLPAPLEAEIERLTQEKFSSREWNLGRSPAGEYRCSRRFPCGTVAVSYRLKHGTLQDVHFSGDFIGNRPAQELASRLEGLPKEALPALQEDIGAWFDQLTKEQLMTLFW